MPGARPASQGAGAARQIVQERRNRQDLLGGGGGRARCRARRNRAAARAPRCLARLVDEARSRRPACGDPMAGDRAMRLKRPREPTREPTRERPRERPRECPTEIDLARAWAFDRAHPSASRPLRRDGLADPGRCDLRQCAAPGRTGAAPARPRSRRAALQKSSTDSRRRPGPGPYARGAGAVRLARGGRRGRASDRARNQYSVSLIRCGWPRSCSGPPILPPLMPARIVPALGRLSRSTCSAGSHNFERTMALLH